jgi:hypothetical protein
LSPEAGVLLPAIMSAWRDCSVVGTAVVEIVGV